jgi:hypothetical protein
MPETPIPADAPRCTECGAVAPAAGQAPEAAEPVTHCEWCGAEYPVPEQK